MSNTPPWADYFTMDNLPNEDLKIVATFIGLEPTVTLICELSGSTISIPKQATLPARKAYIKKHYDGTKKTRNELRRVCNVSENYIDRVVKNR